MSGIVPDNEDDRRKIGFAIGAGCLFGAPDQTFLFVCELLLAGGYKKQYHFVRYLLDDIDVDPDLKRRHAEFKSKIVRISGNRQCKTALSALENYFTSCLDIDLNGFSLFQTFFRYSLEILIKCIDACLKLFEQFAKVKFSDSSTTFGASTEELFKLFQPLLHCWINEYQFIPYPLEYRYNSVTLELEITLPFDPSPRIISYRHLVRHLESIEGYRIRHLRITISNVLLYKFHYDCIINIKNIIRQFSVIDGVQLNFAYQEARHLPDWIEMLDLISARTLSISNVQQIEFSNVLWLNLSDVINWTERLDGTIRDIKIEDNAIYAPLLPMFSTLHSDQDGQFEKVSENVRLNLN